MEQFSVNWIMLSYLTLVILPDNAELNDALGDGDNLESLAVLGLLLEKSGVLEGGSKFCFRDWISSAPEEPLAEDAEMAKNDLEG